MLVQCEWISALLLNRDVAGEGWRENSYRLCVISHCPQQSISIQAFMLVYSRPGEYRRWYSIVSYLHVPQKRLCSALLRVEETFQSLRRHEL